MFKRFLLLFFVFSLVTFGFSQSVTFNYTGSTQSWVVPPCVTSINVIVAGAEGGPGVNGLGGNGASLTASIPVTPGQVLQINVGGMGGVGGASGGFNGGGSGQNANSLANRSAGGGGASDIRFAPNALGNRIIVAGGGGGFGGGTQDGAGGGANCVNGVAGTTTFGGGGAGGTQTGGGGGGAWGSGAVGFVGSLGNGGNGVADPCNNNSPGGGGGGGFFGGGGGGSDCFASAPFGGGGGGGGSSLLPAGGACTPSVNTGNGFVTISWVTTTGVATPTNTGPYCAGSMIQLNSLLADSYAWTGPNGFVSNLQNPTIPGSTVANAGVYTLTTTTGACTATATTTVVVNPSVTPTFTPIATICNGGTFTLPPASLEGITGTWSPAINTAATTTYTFTPNPGQCANTATLTVNVGAALDFVNTQFPENATICEGESVTIFGQVYEAGLTDPNTQAAGIVAEYGVFTSNTDPSTWPPSAWSSGTYNPLSFVNPINDEYMGTVSGLAVGTYYYAFRFSLNGCAFQYGGFSPAGGGFWGGQNVSGVITVSPNLIPTFNQVSPICSGNALAPLPANSLEGISGLWSPAMNNNSTTLYTFVPDAGQCASNTTMSIVVNPNPTVTATPSNSTLCSGDVTGIVLSSLPVGASFNWTTVENNAIGSSAGTGSNISQLLTNSSTSVGTVTYSVTPSFGLCVGTPISVVVTVNPAPMVIATPASQSICNGTSTGINLTSLPAGASFDWSVVESNVNGGSAGTGSSINQSLFLSSGTIGSATYTVTPSSSGCPGLPTDVVISVSAGPVVLATPETICSGSSSGVLLSSNPAGASFNWTFNQTGVVGAFSGSGNSITQTLNSTTTNGGNVIYTVTANIGSCIGVAQDIVVTVSPSPVVTTTPSIQTICSGTTADIAFSSTPLGATFDWTVSQTGASGGSAGNGNSVSGTYLATGPVVGTVVYDVVPTLNGCLGQAVSAVININPSPVVIATPSSQTLCSGTQTGINLTSSPAGSSFSWTVIEDQVMGGFAGNGNTIAQTLTSTTTNQGSATYTVTPSSSGCSGIPLDVVITIDGVITPIFTQVASICSGSALSALPTTSDNGITGSWSPILDNTTTTTYNFTPTAGQCAVPTSMTIFVNPTPVVTATPITQALCSGTSTSIVLTSLPVGSSFDWTVLESGATGASAGTGANITQILSTTSQAVGSVTYTVTPTLNGCLGSPVDVVITVNPIPVALATPSSQTICSGDVTGIALSSSPSGVTFGWSVLENGTTGASAGAGSLIAQTIDATSTNSGTVTYSVTPTFAGCVGLPMDVVINIGSNPVATATPSSQTICSSEVTSIDLSSAPLGATYSWTVSQVGATGAIAGNGSTIGQALSATSATAGTVTYTITPNVGTCVGLPIDVVITVNPTPVVSATPISAAICSGTSTSISLTSNPLGASLDWTATQLGTSGASAGNGTTINQTLNVTGLVSGTTTYSVTPTLLGCVGLPIDIPITVNPTPVVSATPINQTICSNTSPSISLSSIPNGAGFSWTVSESASSGAVAGSGFTINQTLTATGLIQGTATYSVIPTLGACVGTPIDVPIFVNPIPVVTATPASATICSGSASGITLSSSPLGATFTWTVLESNVSGAIAGTGNGINQTLSSTSTAVGTATYTVTPTLNGCVGSPLDVVITVNPIPTALATPASQTICSGDLTSIDLTSTPASSTFTWTVNQIQASGATAGATNNIAQVLNATTSNTGTVTYNVTPTLNGCVGSPLPVIVSVASNPVVIATPASQTICEGTTTGIALSSSPTGATFNWTSSENNATGSSSGTGSNIAQILEASSLVAGTVTYTINSNIGACVGIPLDVVITINPLPTTIATPASQTICATTATGIDLTSSPLGSTYVWSVSQSGTSGAVAGNGTTINQTLNVTGLVAGTATYSITPTLSGCAGSPLDVIITVDPTPTAIATPTTQTICSETAFSIDLSSSPVGSSFGWTVTESAQTGANAGSGSTISEILTVTGITQGTATYTVTPTLGVCVGLPITVPILVNPIPVVTALAAQDTICSATSTSISMSSVPAGSSYAWSSVDNLVTGSSAGSGNTISQILSSTSTAVGSSIYTITPTLSGCVGLPVVVEITVNPLPTVVATPSDQTLCSQETTGIYLTSSPTGSSFGWTVLSANVLGASNGTGNTIAQTLSSIITGTSTYSITPTLNGCVGPVSNVVVTVNPNPTLATNIAATTICVGTAVNLNVFGAVDYVWTPAADLDTDLGSSVVATPLATQTYFVTGTDINNCSSTDSVVITVNPIPVTTVTLNSTICEGNSINLDGNGADSYSWTPTTGLSAIVGANIVASPLVTTTYTVTGTSLNCSSTATVTVFVNPAPTINAGIDSLICYGNGIVLSGSGGVSYAWSGGVVDNVPFFPTSTQTYTVVGTGANQCQDSDQVVVSITPLPIIDLVPSITSGCVPQAVDFVNNTIGGSIYNWDFGDGSTSTLINPSHNYTSVGCYDVTLTASTLNGCTFTTTFPSIVCVELTPTASFFASPSPITTDYPVSTMVNTSQDAVAYSWDFGDGTASSIEVTPTHTFPGSDVTTYTITLVAYSLTGCTDTARVNIEVFEDIVYYVPNAFTPDGDNFNQTFKPIFTSGYDPYDYVMVIYDRWGEVIFESRDADYGWDGTYAGSNGIVKDGTYVWTIEFKVTQTSERKRIEGHVNLLR